MIQQIYQINIEIRESHEIFCAEVLVDVFHFVMNCHRKVLKYNRVYDYFYCIIIAKFLKIMKAAFIPFKQHPRIRINKRFPYHIK